jgi:hypothetical protein|tara:strand:- start:48 stop:392 length:345 start_codon:yes stop_codon:yes gene_type:complete
MDMEQKMESVKEIWNKNGAFLKMQKSNYEELDTTGEDLTPYQQTQVKTMLNQFLLSSIDAWLESMPKEVKKGIMKLDWDSDEEISFVGQFLSDTYNSDGELNFDGQNPSSTDNE